ncbi:MAG: HPF/RaiA family ribosome-associated protein, partial [Clostridia bacterium]
MLLSGTDKRTRMEISIRYKKLQFRSEVEGDTMYYNIDECLPKLERQIVKHLKKSDDKEKLSIPNYEYISEVEEDKVEIAKVKKFQIDSITAEEAAECLDMVGHDFYLFTNVETGNVEAVYRRKDG